ncbi:MAG TPA: acetyl-CoA hydrolase/transferase C-terminal domain-containing protein [Pseudonocardia sp.]|jgi:acyl-CoA hydrolase|nr:acetyl-CoA hydrolase/transferase C-terminal domain-containing protein [Pseudonocardia sp.]
MSELDISEHLRPGDTVVIGQAVGEPPILVEKLIDAARTIEGLTALCGYTLGDSWARVTPGHPMIKSYVGHAAMRNLDPEAFDVLPLHLSRLEDHIRTGRLAADVVLLQVGPADDDGFYNLGALVDYAVIAAGRARAVLVEVNENMPRTRSTRRLHRSQVTAEIESSRPLASDPARPAAEVEKRVAANVASIVPDGAVIQLGASALAEAVAVELRVRRGLRVRSGLVGDWLVGLHEAGALDERPGSVVTGMALGSKALYTWLDGSQIVEFMPMDEQIAPTVTAEFSPFVSINSAVEVDLCGQLNSEMAGGRYVGAVGGQVDYFRAANRSPGGLAVVALASTSPKGTSRIVPELSGGLVTSLKSDVDVVVTEWGIADIAACTLSERRERLLAVAHPDHRASVDDARRTVL